ncbi:MAG: DUF2314 domain-containing protein [Fimbriimonadaceae bacterium]
MKRETVWILGFVGVVIVGINVGRLVTSPRREIREDVIESGSDPEIAAAVATAKKEMPSFLAAIKRGGGEYAINAKFLTKSGYEHVWVKVDTYDKGLFTGKVASKPIELDKNPGDPVEVPEADVSDWTYRLNGVVKGGFTTAVLKNPGAARP